MAYYEENDMDVKGGKSNLLNIIDTIASIGSSIAIPALSNVLGNVVSNGIQSAKSAINNTSNAREKKAGGGMFKEYNKGGTHEENPYGGIPVDYLGNTNIVDPVASVEQGETSFIFNKRGYVFSDRILIPNKKRTFAEESKRIVNKYKVRLGKDLDKNDPIAKKSLTLELKALYQLQEELKSNIAKDKIAEFVEKAKEQAQLEQQQQQQMQQQQMQQQQNMQDQNMQEQPSNPEEPTQEQPTASDEGAVAPQEQPQDVNQLLQMQQNPPIEKAAMGAALLKKKVDKLPKYYTGNPQTDTKEESTETPSSKGETAGKSSYKDYLNTLSKEAYLGYGIQGLTSLIPYVLNKKENVKYDRVTPKYEDYSVERKLLENQTNIAKAQAIKSGQMVANNPSAMLNYMAGVTTSLQNDLGSKTAQSFQNEINRNASIYNTANTQNAEIQIKEAEANAMERDAMRSIRDKALSDLGKAGLKASTVKTDLSQQFNALINQALVSGYQLNWDKEGNITWENLRKLSFNPEENTVSTTDNQTNTSSNESDNPKKRFGGKLKKSFKLKKSKKSR